MERPKIKLRELTKLKEFNPRLYEMKLEDYIVLMDMYCDELQKENESLNADRKLLIDSRQELSNRITTLEHENEELKEQIKVLEKALFLATLDYDNCESGSEVHKRIIHQYIDGAREMLRLETD